MSKSNHFKKYGGEVDDYTSAESRKDRRSLRRQKSSKRDELTETKKSAPKHSTRYYYDDDN